MFVKSCVNCRYYYHKPGSKPMCLVFADKNNPHIFNFMDPQDARKDPKKCGPTGTFFVKENLIKNK